MLFDFILMLQRRNRALSALKSEAQGKLLCKQDHQINEPMEVVEEQVDEANLNLELGFHIRI